VTLPSIGDTKHNIPNHPNTPKRLKHQIIETPTNTSIKKRKDSDKGQIEKKAS